MKRIIVLSILALAIVLPLSAQRAKIKTVKKKVAMPEVKQEDPRLAQMLEATQRIVFIDSIVVDKESFLSQYWLSSESGELMTFEEFFHEKGQPYSIVYLNELGNKAYFAKSGTLYTTDLLGGKEWNTAVPMAGLNDGQFTHANYPFMMADGITFYFAAQGPESIGGLDIFMTRYDSGTGRFFLPENIGMPFNSEANDYMMAIDEINNLGFFATDRRQPEGKVCIYVFIPSQTRLTYENDDLDENVLRDLADIKSIADTWENKDAKDQAIRRLQAMKKNKEEAKSDARQRPSFDFFIDDQTTYHALTDFRNIDNRTRFMELQQNYNKMEALGKELEEQRRHFSSSRAEERDYLSQEILRNEKNFYELQSVIKKQEKEIRNSEISVRQP